MANANPGDRFGRLVVIERADDYITPSDKKYPRYLCKCDCGNVKKIDNRMKYGWSFEDAVNAPADARSTRGNNKH